MDARRSAGQFRHLRPGASVAGVDHLGIQVETGEELAELAGRLKAAGEVTRDQEATTCCYARSDKAWVNDPNGLRWETFFTFGEATIYGEDEPGAALAAPKAACCAPAETAPAPAPMAACCSREAGHGRRSLQRSLPLHRQFGALDHGRGDHEPDRARRSSGPTPPAPCPRARSIRAPLEAAKRQWLPRRHFPLEELGGVRGAGRAASSISCSPSATTPPPRSARSGRASR